MQNFCKFEVDFHVIKKAVHLNCGFQVRCQSRKQHIIGKYIVVSFFMADYQT